MSLFNIVITAIAAASLGACLVEHARVNRLEAKVDSVERKQMMAEASRKAHEEARRAR